MARSFDEINADDIIYGLSSPRPTKSFELLGPPEVPTDQLDFVDTIGEGGFSEVWEGRWFGAPVAIKRLRLDGKDVGEAEAAEAAFRREIILHASLTFPFVVPVLGACLESPADGLMMIMEQAPLGSLFGLLHCHENRVAPYVRNRRAVC